MKNPGEDFVDIMMGLQVFLWLLCCSRTHLCENTLFLFFALVVFDYFFISLFMFETLKFRSGQGFNRDGLGINKCQFYICLKAFWVLMVLLEVKR